MSTRVPTGSVLYVRARASCVPYVPEAQGKLPPAGENTGAARARAMGATGITKRGGRARPSMAPSATRVRVRVRP
eukprot:scaffold63267_cov48-Phaeocystis_antarctica.AAC.2